MKLFIFIKHDLIIDRDMPETRRQKILIKNLVKNCRYFLLILSIWVENLNSVVSKINNKNN